MTKSLILGSWKDARATLHILDLQQFSKWGYPGLSLQPLEALIVYSRVLFSSCGKPNLFHKDAFWLWTWLKIKTRWENRRFRKIKIKSGPGISSETRSKWLHKLAPQQNNVKAHACLLPPNPDCVFPLCSNFHSSPSWMRRQPILEDLWIR